MNRCIICGKLHNLLGAYCTEHIDNKKKIFYPTAVKNNKGLYATKRWRLLRKQVIEMYRRCNYCGGDTLLEVHHIIPPKGDEELFFSINNLMVLCKYCHARVTNKEVYKNKKK